MAPLDWNTASIKFGPGLDTKTDPKAVRAKMLALSNGIFTAPNRISKRNGYDSLALSIIGGGSLSSPVMTRSFQNRLTIGAGGRLYDYSTALTKSKNAGAWDSIQTTNVTVSGTQQTNLNTQCIISGNYAVVCYEQNSLDQLFISLVDLNTNTTISAETLVQSNARSTKMFLFPDGTIGLFYVRSGGTDLTFRPVTIGSTGLTLAAEQTVVTLLQTYNTAVSSLFYAYDIVASGNNCVIFYSTSTAGNPIGVKSINSAGTSQGTASIAAAGLALPLSVVPDSGGNFWIYWAVPTATNHAPTTAMAINYAILSSSFSSVLGKTRINNPTTYDYVRQITAQAISTSAQNVMWSNITYTAGSSAIDLALPNFTAKQVSSAGAGSASTAVVPNTNFDIFGRVFTYNSKNYLPVVFPSSDQFTGFIIDLADGHMAAKFLVNSAEGAYATEVNSDKNTGGTWWRMPGFLIVAQAYGSSIMMFGSGKIVATYLGAGSTIPKFSMIASIVSLTWSASDAFQAIECNGSLILNGSIPCLYDGNYVSELGFHFAPEINCVGATAGGSLADGTYGVQVIYQWTDANGNLYQSPPSDLISVVISGGGGAGKITTSIKDYFGNYSASTTNASHSATYAMVFRTQSAGTIPYFVGTLSTTGVGTFTDTGANLDLSFPLYTNGGAVLNNSPPPASMIMWINNQRLWMLNSETQEIWYSKTFSTLGGVQMSDSLLMAPDSRFGNVRGGIAMDEKTLLLKDTGLTYFIGDGANDAGQNATLTLPQPIPSDVGCSGSKGIILFPAGVLFRASNSKGIYIITRGTQVQYFGAEVESYNSQDIQDATMIPSKSQIRFLTSSGSSLVYDYIMNQWSTFSNHTGYSGCVWNGVYVYARVDGSIYTENTTSFLDNSTAFALSGSTEWIKAASTQNFQRVRETDWLGDFQGASGHGLRVAAAVDFSSSSTNLSTYSFSGINAPFQFRGFLPQQKCDALQLIFTEITTGASGEFIDLTDLTLVIGLKKGAFKLPASKSVG